MCTEQLPPGGYPIAVKYIIQNQYFVKSIYYVHDRCSAFMSLGLMMMEPYVIYVCTPFLLLIRHRLSSRF